ncbi:MAG: hypothetical protein MPK62_02435 [Alphaproteobacteria bacterium]|nr:hypothetical protein [Alphaproteobacteria bacterium]
MPKREPIFHISLRLDGAGRSTRNEFIGVNSWCDLRGDFGMGYHIQRGLVHDLNFKEGKHDGELKCIEIEFM